MASPSLTIKKTFKRHREECPDSGISEKMIRAAVKSGELPAVMSGNRALICWDTFESWRRGELNEH